MANLLTVANAARVLVFVAASGATFALLSIAGQLSRSAAREVGTGRHAWDSLASVAGAWAVASGRAEAALRRLRRELGRAGRVGEDPLAILGRAVLIAAAAGVGLAVLVALIGRLARPSGLLLSMAVLGSAASAATFSIMLLNVRQAADRRVSRIVRQLPYSIDLAVLAMEAGAAFDEALQLLARDLPNEPLHTEFAQVLRDQRLGRDRRTAFRAMAERLDAEDVSTLVLALEMGADLGTPIGETLHRQSEDLRVTRLLRADRLAREASAKMALPNTLIMAANVLLIVAPFLPKLLNGGLP